MHPLAKRLRIRRPQRITMRHLRVAAGMERFRLVAKGIIHHNAYALLYNVSTGVTIEIYAISVKMDGARGRRIMANMPAFQASDASSILAARTKVKTVPWRTVFTLFLLPLTPSSSQQPPALLQLAVRRVRFLFRPPSAIRVQA